MTEEILTEQELMVLSDAATRPTMRAWLEANNIPYLIARSGWRGSRNRTDVNGFAGRCTKPPDRQQPCGFPAD